MIAFISYALNESEKYVVTLLAQKLQEKGFSLTSGFRQASNFVDFQTENEIKNSSLFIGLITNSFTNSGEKKVYLELQVAQKYKKPIILLLEHNAPLDFEIANIPNLIRFDRYSPQIAMEEVKQQIQFSQSQPQQDNTLAWLIGGGIAAIALISLLSDEKNKVKNIVET